MGKSSGKEQTTSVKYPGWVNDFAKQNVNLAGQIAARPYQANPWMALAGFSPEQEAAFRGVVNQQGAYKPWLQQGASTTAMIAGTAAPSAQMMSAYMDPYTRDVIDANATDIERQRQQQVGGIRDQAHAARAFGGDRGAFAEAEATRSAQDTLARTSAGLRSAGWQNAISAAQSDLAMQLGASQQLAGMAQQGQTMDYRDLAALEAVGGQRQQLKQGQLDLEANKWQGAWDYPANMLNLRLAALGQSPYGSSTSQPLTRNTAAGVLGGAATGAGAAMALGATGPWGWGLAGLGALAGAL